jgi:hypothetical protein
MEKHECCYDDTGWNCACDCHDEEGLVAYEGDAGDETDGLEHCV